MPDINNYNERLDALFQLEFFGMKLGLQNIHDLLDELGRPERTYPTIHIAGTNGKGSVAAMLSAVYQSDGRKVGLYTSPHLVDFRERIKINGELISEDFIASFLSRIWPKVQELNATFFEVTTALAFDYFASENVDIAIIETGLGGRLDATNVLEKPLATIVTSIGYDHMAQLGNTLELIASEKAGIFKAGVPAVVNCDRDLEDVFASHASDVGAPLLFVEDWKIPDVYSKLTPSLNGEHQKDNLKTVLAALSVLPDPPGSRAIDSGIENTASLTGLRARLEEVTMPEWEARGVRLILDVGHNEAALRRIEEFLTHEGARPIVVMGLMQDKDVESVLEIVKRFAKRLVAVAAPSRRSMSASDLSAAAANVGLEAVDCPTVDAGVRYAFERTEQGDIVLLTGSHYVVGEFLKNF